MNAHARNVERDVVCGVATVASRQARHARLGATPPIGAMLAAEEAS